MTNQIKHIGVLGMHWGHKKGSTESSGTRDHNGSATHSNESLSKKMEDTSSQKAKAFDINKVLTGKNVAKGILVAYGALAIHAAYDHLSHHPIKIEIDYTRPPFKWKKPPFYSVKVGKSIARKLLPGG